MEYIKDDNDLIAFLELRNHDKTYKNSYKTL